jgi:hypothetical protein
MLLLSRKFADGHRPVDREGGGRAVSRILAAPARLSCERFFWGRGSEGSKPGAPAPLDESLASTGSE